MTVAARAITSPELTLLRTEGQWGKYRAAVLAPTTVYSARVNQTFSSTDNVLEITYDGGSGTLANVLADMTMWVGTTPGSRDLGICRVRSIDSSKVYIGKTSYIAWVNDLYLTIKRDWSLWAKPIVINDSGTAFMDGGIAYSDQHKKFDPIPIMGCHRVLKLVGSTVSTQWSFSNSYVPDSTISSYLTSAPSASATSGLTTSTPTTTFNSVGWHPVYFTPTAANGKSFMGVRWVYVWSETSPPPSVEFPSSPRQEAETGGWQFTIRMLEDVDVSTIQERALVIVFEEAYYGTTNQSIGQLAGCENIILTGWIGGEEDININPMQGQVGFTAYTAHHWLGKIPSYPDGVRFSTIDPTRWTEIKNLTIDKGLHHFLHWRTTATRLMDVILTGDTRLCPEMYSIAGNLWEQIREISFLKIFARAGVDRFNRLFIQIHPQLVPPASRTWATVMTITKADLVEAIELKRITVQPNSFVDLSTVSINSNGKGTPYFSLSPGRAYPPHGSPEILDHLLGSTQTFSNTLAGLYRGWLNNELPDISVKFLANNRMIDCFPAQKCVMTIEDTDTPRGVEYTSIGLIPKEIQLIFGQGGYLHTEITFEAETFPDIAINGDVPGTGDISIPPLPPLPPLPPIEISVPGTVEVTLEGPPKILMHDVNVGLVYTENFNALSGADVEYVLINAGLDILQYQQINYMELLPDGRLLVAHRRRTGLGTSPFIAIAPYIGGTFTIIEDITTIAAKYPGTPPDFISVNAVGHNPLTGQIAYVIGIQGNFTASFLQFYVGDGVNFTAGMDLSPYLTISAVGSLTFGHDNWRLTGTPNNVNGSFYSLDASGSSIITTVNGIAGFSYHIPISTTDAIIMPTTISSVDGLIRITANGTVAGDFTTLIGSEVNQSDHWDNFAAIDPSGTYGMLSWDTGQRGRTSDGFSSIVGMPTLPFGGDYAYAWAGGTGSESRWIAVKGIIRYSNDWGSIWENREGNILNVAPIPSFDIVKVVEF